MYVQVQEVSKNKKKDFCPCIRHEVEVQLQLFFTSELEEHEWSGFPRGKGPPYPLIAATEGQTAPHT
jgi:hypothetical protein